MTAASTFERALETPVEKVAEQKDDGPPVQKAIEIIEPFSKRRFPGGPAEKKARRESGEGRAASPFAAAQNARHGR